MEKMGKRRLAYTVRRFNEGIYILLMIEGSGGLVHELERRLRVTEPVIKFLTVRMDEEQKRLDKIKKIREARKQGCGAGARPRKRAEKLPQSRRKNRRWPLRRWSFAQGISGRKLQVSATDDETTNDERPILEGASWLTKPDQQPRVSILGGDRPPGERPRPPVSGDRASSAVPRVRRTRRPRRRKGPQVFPPQESLQVLRRED